MVKVLGVPVQPLIVGVTVMVANWAVLLFVFATKEGILPEPFAARPIAVFVFVQLYTVLFTAPAKITGAVLLLLHNTWSAGCCTSGTGFTVIITDLGEPLQPFADGVTVMIPVVTFGPLVVATNEGILPVPFAARPIAVLVLVQLYAVLVTAPLKLMGAVLLLLQSVC